MLNLPLTHDFTGKVVVVTGAGGVLCGDMARAYAQAGAKGARPGHWSRSQASWIPFPASERGDGPRKL